VTGPGEAGITGQLHKLPPVPDNPTAVSMFTAHRVNDISNELAHAEERMQVMRKTSGDLRHYNNLHFDNHLKIAMDQAGQLKDNMLEHYPAEAAEWRALNQVMDLASGYSLNPRSGMISLDLPSGAISPVPGGVDDHHITVVYLGPDVDDAAFAKACDRARAAAAAMPGPLSGTVGGIGTFKPSGGSDGKTVAWAGVVLPGADRVQSSLQDLSASEHKDWKPHVTLAYMGPGEPLPAPVPQTPVRFTHLSVHRGKDVVRFPLGGGPVEMSKAVNPAAKAASFAHLLQTIMYDGAHAQRHSQAMLDDTDDTSWNFDADHADKHLKGAHEHARKLSDHIRDNYPAEARWLDELIKKEDLSTVSRQAVELNITGQLGHGR
jgi:2'-5' RNA ligase